mmetsp:Transcript_14586/g.20614  ORF Transcript_14586/g.20614 Transcript_14586/m.20614 type:complete len:371 (-) Transcript_14586:173-1285(-)
MTSLLSSVRASLSIGFRSSRCSASYGFISTWPACRSFSTVASSSKKRAAFVTKVKNDKLLACNYSTSAPRMMANVDRLGDPKAFLDELDVFIFDMDGVIWRGDSLIDGVPETLRKLRDEGKQMFFVTNNSTKSRAGYKKKFDNLGLDFIPSEEIFSSSFSAAAYLEMTKFKESGKKVYVIGEVGIGEELDLIGIPWLGGVDDKGKQPPMGPGDRLEHDHDVGAVVVGFDRNFNYYKIQYAQLCINENPDCQFIATNLDAVTHLTDAQEWAGGGSMVGAIKGCTGREPTVVGKPSPLMIDYLCDKFGFDRKRICMVGDRLDTDIVFGSNNGLQTLLVLSGVTSEAKLLSPENQVTPTLYTDSIVNFFSSDS